MTGDQVVCPHCGGPIDTYEHTYGTVTIEPCGHTTAPTILTEIAKLRVQQWQLEADETIAAVRPLLDAAEAAGYFSLADAYRCAVRARSGVAEGLLAALQLVCPAGALDLPASLRLLCGEEPT